MAWFGRKAPRPRTPPPPPCPLCGKPTNLDGRFCRACGWDADLEESDDRYLDGVELPTGWGEGEEEAVEPGSKGGRVFFVIVVLLALGSFVYTMVL